MGIFKDPHAKVAPTRDQVALSVFIQLIHTINTINSNSWHPLGYIPSKNVLNRGFPKTFWFQWNSSIKGRITSQKHGETRLICMTKVPDFPSTNRCISYWGKSPILGFSNAQISLNPKLSSKALSARPVAAAIWPKRWGNDQAAGRRQTRRRGGVTTRGVPRGCVGGQVGRGGRARACL